MKHLGITKSKTEVVAQLGLDEYKKLLDDAVSETNDWTRDMKNMLKLKHGSLIVLSDTNQSSSGGSPVVSNVVPFSKPYSQSG